MSDKSRIFKCALISMPWSIFTRPSAQLGTLKAFLQQDEAIQVDTFHPYLGAAREIGTEVYQCICRNSWAGEALYSSLLFPEHSTASKKVFAKNCADKKIVNDFSSLRSTLKQHLDNWMVETDLGQYSLIGFSVCFSQLFGSLLAAERIKHSYPHCSIVFGGSSCVDEIGKSLLLQFPQLDYVIDGEGETPLLELCRFLSGKKNTLPQQIHSRSERNPIPCHSIEDLNSLPTPDYSDYFHELKTIFPEQPFVPTLPLEFSRGCWWRKCTFCNLNLQWHGYRWKNSEKMTEEVNTLLRRHQCLDFTFCDNALPEKETAPFFHNCEKSDKDFRFFAEVRTIKKPETLAIYRSGGLTTVQVGIESLSSTLLKKMKKGTTVIENLAMMKHCLENGIKLEGNLIVEFPGSTEAEVEETLKNIDFALPFNPLSPATFFLGHGSPIERHPQRFRISAVTQHRYNSGLLPEQMLKNMEMLIKDFRGDNTRQKSLWKPIRQKLKTWQQFHKKRSDTVIPPLSYRDGGTFIVIRQEQLQGKPLLHRLQGTSRKLYLYCNTMHSLAEIKLHFPSLKEKTVLNFFNDLCNKNLLFHENNTFLALASRV